MSSTYNLTSSTYNLTRFIKAQESIYDSVLRELRSGGKRGHWMWYIFPQLRGLGTSPDADFYGIGSIDEARYYLDHPILGARLQHCTQLVNKLSGRKINEIFSSPDDLKFRSCMTLFQAVAPQNRQFNNALKNYFEDIPDKRTVSMLRIVSC